MFDTFENRLTLNGTLVTLSGFRIGSGRSTEPVGTDLPLLKDALERPFIPGSSFKGVLRSQVESLVRAIVPGKRGACIPTGQETERCISNARMAELRQLHGDDDAVLAGSVRRESCLVCLTFGSPWLASHLQVRDLLVDEASWFGQFQVRDGVAIDRDKGTAGDGKLYNYETVPAGTRFTCQLVLENAEDWQRGLLWLALRPFIKGEAALGGFTSRGLGWVRLEQPDLRLVQAGPDPAALINAWLGEGDAVTEDQKRSWTAALKTKLQDQARASQGEKNNA